MKSLEGLVEIKNDPRILFVRVIGNGGHSGYSLPSCNKEMGKHMIWLAERGIQGVCSTMLATVGKYDSFHLHDHQFNRARLSLPPRCHCVSLEVHRGDDEER